MTVLDLAVILIGILSVLTSVAVVALTRQVGVLHLRIQPVAGVTGVGGPEYGTSIRLPAPLPDLAGRPATRFLVGFVSPSCQVCGPVTSALGRVARSSGPGTAVLLVVDSSQAGADEYVRGKSVSFLPYIADQAAFAGNVPGAPWVIVTDGAGKVIVSGGVNTLDNIEEMLAQADQLIAHPPAPAAPAGPAAVQISQRVEAGEHAV